MLKLLQLFRAEEDGPAIDGVDIRKEGMQCNK